MADLSVLIVEDHAANLKLMQYALRSYGYQPLAAGTAEEALAVLADASPHLLLVDLNLPGRSGLDLARELRSTPETASLPMIAVTATVLSELDREEATTIFDGFVTKPVDFNHLSEVIRDSLRLRQEA